MRIQESSLSSFTSLDQTTVSGNFTCISACKLYCVDTYIHYIIVYGYIYIHIIVYRYIYIHIIVYRYIYVHIIVYRYIYVHIDTYTYISV